MKRKKSILGAVVLSTVLVGNVFASNATTNDGFFSFFDNVTNAVVSFFDEAEPCEGRQCQPCKPTFASDGTTIASASPGNCRPND